MIFLFTLVCIVFIAIMIGINDEHRWRNSFISLMVISILFSLLAQLSLVLGDNSEVSYLSFFQLNRQTLVNFVFYLYAVAFISLLGYLFADYIEKRKR